ncbi:integrase core domain-containing protein [Streptomyces sp. NPDC053431]|uniref:integrase core domain-containing protein n=1 Tax=Streptomyces sp. NPDC053431 TaxID=3365703 RepID=UPI0037D281ED
MAPRDPRQSRRFRLPLRPPSPLRLQGLRRPLRPAGSPVHGAISSADNAACDSFHASLKRETLQGARDYDGPDCRKKVFAWLTRYNTRRRQSANGHLSPSEYERRHHTAKLTLAA